MTRRGMLVFVAVQFVLSALIVLMSDGQRDYWKFLGKLEAQEDSLRHRGERPALIYDCAYQREIEEKLQIAIDRYTPSEVRVFRTINPIPYYSVGWYYHLPEDCYTPLIGGPLEKALGAVQLRSRVVIFDIVLLLAVVTQWALIALVLAISGYGDRFKRVLAIWLNAASLLVTINLPVFGRTPPDSIFGIGLRVTQVVAGLGFLVAYPAVLIVAFIGLVRLTQSVFHRSPVESHS